MRALVQSGWCGGRHGERSARGAVGTGSCDLTCRMMVLEASAALAGLRRRWCL